MFGQELGSLETTAGQVEAGVVGSTEAHSRAAAGEAWAAAQKP